MKLNDNKHYSKITQTSYIVNVKKREGKPSTDDYELKHLKKKRFKFLSLSIRSQGHALRINSFVSKARQATEIDFV